MLDAVRRKVEEAAVPDSIAREETPMTEVLTFLHHREDALSTTSISDQYKG